MRITLGPRAEVAVGTLHDVAWPDLVAWLTQHPRHTGEKNGPWVAFAEFTGNYRHLSSTPRGCAIPVDLDYSGLSAEAIAATLHGYRWCAYTTYQHTAAAPRWRVIVPVEGILDAATHRSTWNVLNQLFGNTADVSAKDITRLNYLPGACLAPADAAVIRGEGTLFPVVPAPPPPTAQADPEASEGPVDGWSGPLDDTELLQRAFAIRTRPGERFGGTTLLEALWTANAEVLADRYPSKEPLQAWDYTRADMALANELSYYTGRDRERVMRLMLQSASTTVRGEPDGEMERKLRYACTRAVAREDVFKWPAAAPLVSPEALAKIPDALHLCTDQANAHRLLAAYGNQIISAAGRFYCWTGTHWAGGDQTALSFGCNLSRLVRTELEPAREHLRALMSGEAVAAHLKHPRKVPMPDDFAIAEAIVGALEKWAKDCEMRSTINNALAMLKTLLEVPMGTLDADPWLLNCRNGTVDLRTGELRPHNAADRITRCIALDYTPEAAAPRFERFMLEVFSEDVDTVGFLQRAFGYSATGSGREQCMLVHWGKGQNGKNTLHKAIRHVLGPYAQTAPPGLLTSTKEGSFIHEIANLYGARWVSVDESDDGARIREAAMKQMTGDDDVKGRHLYEDFFQYRPTFKLHLMTNHKPRVVGTDHGVWRRLLLVPYDRVFDGARRDTGLDARLEAESPGILAWVVRGALQWFAAGSLNPSERVLKASADYRGEEDMLGQFLQEQTTQAPGHDLEFKLLYPIYTAWCNLNGGFRMSKKRLVAELRERPGISIIMDQHTKAPKLCGIKLYNSA